MQKTTLYLDEPTRQRLRLLAAASGQSQAAVVREAVRAYRPAARRRPRSIGLGASERGDLSERSEDLLDGFGEDL
jgi:predicted transcriptional regulator